MLVNVVTADRRSLLIRGDTKKLLEELTSMPSAGSISLWRRLEELGATSWFDPSADQALDASDRERFARQLDYLEDVLGDRRTAVSVQARILRVRVGVVGMGGVGCHVVEALATLGVRNFRLADADVVALSNLVRQPLYRLSDVGRTKVSCAARWLREFANADVEEHLAFIADESAARQFADGVDVVISTAGPISTSLNRWFSRATAATCVELIPVGGSAFGPVVSATGQCWECVESQLDGMSPTLAESLRDFLPEFTTAAHTPVFDSPLRVTAGRFAAEFLGHLVTTGSRLAQGVLSSAGPDAALRLTPTYGSRACDHRGLGR